MEAAGATADERVDAPTPGGPPVVAHLVGGLGNQMFQYAAARALSLRLGRSLLLDLSDLVRDPLRSFGLDRFRAPVRRAPRRWRWLMRAARTPLRHIVPAGRRVVHLRETSPAFAPWPDVPETAPIFVSGYRQSERYFAEIADVIRNDFTPAVPATGRTAALLDELAAVDAVAVHVRRGDYVSDPEAAAWHGTCGPDYYARAQARIEQAVPRPRYVVFSDDIPWARDHLRFAHPVTFVDHNADAPWDDLRLMAACRHFVIANSTFSWWGAWLSTHPGKSVIAPRRWFAVDPDGGDRVPAAWMRV